VQDFLEGKGLAEYNMNIILDQLNNPGYVNVLKRNQIYAEPVIPQQQVVGGMQRQMPV
jgi:hypothetical protein